MISVKDPVVTHYDSKDLYNKICKALENSGINLSQIKRTDLSPVDQFHVRGEAASIELFSEIDFNGKDILDLGCGIGGLSRFLADEKGGRVTGIDLNPTYIETAKMLTRLCKLNHEITFLTGDAADLPLQAESFDFVCTQHVQMNIENKDSFYNEIERVLRQGGKFIYYDIFRKSDNAITFPVPWASDESISFLNPKENIHNILFNLGFTDPELKDHTETGILFFEKLLQKIKNDGLPHLGLHLLMGENSGIKIYNLLEGLRNGNIEIESGVFIKS